ncbi:hypothetical protein Vadar_029016 [Vaccinium darrowii]|uniref:Uncharacterized protein n=1 Tax=Vaccinium darrowii TaxID=229202 RepID=A0ACB7Z6T6_9ERIC|nr:hypothetical protein Vadar_029016 [Vaccinium darrowii]
MEISCRLEFLLLPPKYLALEDDGFPPKIFMADKNPFPHSPVLSLAISVSSPLTSDDPFSSILLSSCDGAFNSELLCIVEEVQGPTQARSRREDGKRRRVDLRDNDRTLVEMKKKRYHISTTENRSEPTNSVGASQSSDASQHPLSHGSSLPVQQGNDYERARIENIQRNNEELRSRGMREIPIPSMDVVQHNSVNENVNENGKRMRVDVDDNDYRLAHSHGVSRPYQSRSASRAEPHVPLQDPSPNFSQPQLAEDGFDMGDELDGENEVGIRDESGKPNKRGITRLSDIWNMPPGSRIVVKFNAALRPVGQEGIVFNRFIGTVVRKPNLCPIHYNDWRKVPYQYKLDCWNIIESKLEFPEDEGTRDKIKKDTLKSLGEKLRHWRCSLKSQHYDLSKTAAQIVAAAPATVNRDHYAELVDFWFTEEGVKLSNNNKIARGENKVPHTAGTKTYSQHAYDMGEKTGVGVDRAEMYKLTHMKGDKPVNDIAAENISILVVFVVWDLGTYTSTNNGSTYDIARRFNMTSEEERMQDKETIRDLQEKLEANNQKLEANNQQLEANNQQMDTMASEMNFLRTQVDFLLRHSGL